MNSDMLTRITRYYRALNRLRAIGLEKVFAHNLADAAGVNAVIVRKDFSLLGIHGQKRGGYDILPLVTKLGDLLGKGEPQNVIIVGCGRIGKALMHYSGFEPDGIRIVAGFDTDPLVYSDASHPIPLLTSPPSCYTICLEIFSFFPIDYRRPYFPFVVISITLQSHF